MFCRTTNSTNNRTHEKAHERNEMFRGLAHDKENIF